MIYTMLLLFAVHAPPTPVQMADGDVYQVQQFDPSLVHTPTYYHLRLAALSPHATPQDEQRFLDFRDRVAAAVMSRYPGFRFRNPPHP